MKPALIFPGDLGKLRQGIDYSSRSCAGNANYTKGNATLSSISFDRGAQQIDANVESLICIYLPQALATEAENVNALLYREVTLFRCVNHQVPGHSAHAKIANLTCGLVAGTLQGD